MNEIERINLAKQEIILCKSLPEIKLLKDSAIAATRLMKLQGAGEELIGEGNDLIKIAFIRMNELIKTGQKNGEIRKHNDGTRVSSKTELTQLGVTKKESHVASTIARHADELGHIPKHEATISKLYTEAKKIERKEKIDVQIKDIESGIKTPDGKYDVIVIDPPWNYGRQYDANGSRASNPYPELNHQELKTLEIPANENAILWLWTTQAFIWDAKLLLDYWGFDYKAILTWDKEKMGMGYWLRMQTEFCIFAVKGKPTWDNTTFRDIIREPGREHSRKPEAFYNMVDEICYGKKLEYFARETRTGWDSIGNETKKYNG